MRLQLFLSCSGACSRRKALIAIQNGRVTVNGREILEPSFDVTPGQDRICLDGKPLQLLQKIYILLNKPQGVVSTVSDRFAKKTVLDLLPQTLRHVHPVGRLDKDTTGLLLLTNDGALTQGLIHPSFEIDKVYHVELDKSLDDSDRHILEHGVMLEGRKTAPSRLKKISSQKWEMTIHEGRKRQIRKMFSLLRYRVVSLHRIRQGPLELGTLKMGAWRFLTKEETGRLSKALKWEPSS